MQHVHWQISNAFDIVNGMMTYLGQYIVMLMWVAGRWSQLLILWICKPVITRLCQCKCVLRRKCGYNIEDKYHMVFYLRTQLINTVHIMRWHILKALYLYFIIMFFIKNSPWRAFVYIPVLSNYDRGIQHPTIRSLIRILTVEYVL